MEKKLCGATFQCDKLDNYDSADENDNLIRKKSHLRLGYVLPNNINENTEQYLCLCFTLPSFWQQGKSTGKADARLEKLF